VAGLHRVATVASIVLFNGAINMCVVRPWVSRFRQRLFDEVSQWAATASVDELVNEANGAGKRRFRQFSWEGRIVEFLVSTGPIASTVLMLFALPSS